MITIKKLRRNSSKKRIGEIIECLSQLYDSTKMSTTISRRLQAQRCVILAAYDSKQIVGTATLFIMCKLLRDCGQVALVEDVAVQSSYQGKGVGRLLIEACRKEAERHKCYKIMLYCDNDVIPFYEKCGYHQSCTLMRRDLM